MNENEITIEDIKEEKLKKILKEIEENKEKYEREAKYILFVEEYYYRSGEFPASREYKVMVGKPEIIEIDRKAQFDEEFIEYVVIPKQIPTVIMEVYYNSRGEEYDYEKSLHIFDGDGWVAIPIKNG
jgi:hypothetical protein